MDRFQGDDLQDQHIEHALRQVRLGRRHDTSGVYIYADAGVNRESIHGWLANRIGHGDRDCTIHNVTPMAVCRSPPPGRAGNRP